MMLYRSVGLGELRLIAASAFRGFPPRLPEQPIFSPVLSIEYARMIARDRNTTDPASGFAGFVTQFEIDSEFAARYPVQVAGGGDTRELWVPAAELTEFNRHIIGAIAVVEAFAGDSFDGRTARWRCWLLANS